MAEKNNKEKNNSKRGVKKYILILLAIGLLASVVFNVYWIFNKMKNAGVITSEDKYNLLNPARKLVKQEDLIVNFQPLRDYLNDKYEADPNVSIYFEYLPTGANVAISKDAEFFPASLLKVPVAMAVAKKIEKGEWKWDNKLVLMASDKDEKFGDLYKKPVGSIFTIEELAERSLVDSDNTAHFILLRNLELSEVSDVYNHIGLKGFLDSDGKISAKRYSSILRALYNSSYLSEENSQKLVSFLSQAKFRDYLGRALPEGVIFAHKIGIEEEKGVYLDSGIVYQENRPYILIAMIKINDEQRAKAIMKDISEKVYNYINDYVE